MIWPLLPDAVGRIGQSVCTGCRDDGHAGKRDHQGIDLYAPGGTVVAAPVDGTIIRVVNGAESDSERGQRAGLWVDLQAMDGRIHRFLHLGHATVSAGQKVKEGDSLGDVADAGSGVEHSDRHLHYEIRQKPGGGDAYGPPVDPRRELADALIAVTERASNYLTLMHTPPDGYELVLKQIERAKKQEDPGKRLVEARAAYEGVTKIKGGTTIWGDAYYYLRHPKEGLKTTATAVTQAAIDTGKDLGSGVLEIIGMIWDAIPLWAKIGGGVVAGAVVINAVDGGSSRDDEE